MRFSKTLKHAIAAVTACCVSLSAGAGAFTDTIITGNVNTQYLSLGSETAQDSLVFTELEDGTYEVGYNVNGSKPAGSLVIPETVNGKPVTRIAEAGFYGCDKLTNVTVPDSVTSAGANAFTGTPFQNDQSSDVKYAGKIAVFCDSSAENVTIKDGTLGLADRLFSLTPGLRSAVLPESLINIGNMTFMDCAELTSVNVPSGIVTIGSGVFYGCSALSYVELPAGVTAIGSYAFAESGITSANIPNAVKIGKGAFENSKLAAGGLTVGSGYIDIGGIAFNGTAFFDALGAEKYVGTVFVGCSGDAENVSIAEGTTAVADMAFSGKKKLRSVTIPASVKTIGADAFFNCNRLDTAVVIPEGVESIGEDAFRLCGSIPSVSLPISLKSSGTGAFYGCDNITSVSYPGTLSDWANIITGDEYSTPTVSPVFGSGAAAPAPVTELRVTGTDGGSISLAWNKSELANRYSVEVFRNDAWVNVGNTFGDNTSFTVTGLTQFTDYELRVCALTHNTSSQPVSVTGKTKVAPVTNIHTASDSESVTVSWDKQEGAGYYRADVFINGKWSVAATTADGSVNSCTIKGLSPKTEYLFRIFTFVGDNYSTEVSFTASTTQSDKPSAVTGLAAATTTNSVTLTWDMNPMADRYQVDIYKNGAWTYVATTTDTVCNVTGLSPNSEYQLRVFAFKGDKYSTGAYITAATQAPVSTKPTAVTGLTASPSTNSVALSWNKNPGADNYQVDMLKNGAWTYVTRTTDNSYTITGLSANTRYQFRVFAFRDSEYSSSTGVNAVTAAVSNKPAAVTGLTASSTANSIALSWNSSANADRYQVDIMKNGVWTYAASTSKTSCTISGLSANTGYQFRIFAFKGSEYSSSAKINAATSAVVSGKPATVSGFSASPSANSITLSWSKSTTADRYQIDMYKNGKWVYVAQTTATSYTVSGLAANTSYQFRIFAFKGNSYSSSTKITASTTTATSGKPAVVTGFSASPSANSIKLSWNKVMTADRYQIDMYKNGKWVYVTQTTGTSYTVSGLAANTSYQFRIFAFKGNSYSSSVKLTAATGTASGKPAAVTGFSSSSSVNSVKLSWNKSAAADRYQIDMYKNGKWVYVTQTTGTSYTVSGLAANTEYQFRIFAFKGSSYSSSAKLTAATVSTSGKPAAVTGLSADSTSSSVTLSWNRNAAADSYQIDMMKNGVWTYVAKVTGTSYKVNGLTPGNSYQFKVFAFRGSSYSASAKINSSTKTLLAPLAASSSSVNITPAALSSVNTMMKGIDVSGWQGVIDFNAVKESGIDFVIVKAGERNSTVDTWETNYANAKRAGLLVGSYWYSRAVTLEEGKREANAFIAALSGKKLEFPVFFDLEESAQFSNGKEFCTDLVETFCGTLEEAGYCSGVYCSTYWYTNFVSDSMRNKRPAWIADYRGHCYYDAAYGMWQYDIGRVAGIDGDCDCNRGYIDYSKYIISNHLNGF